MTSLAAPSIIDQWEEWNAVDDAKLIHETLISRGSKPKTVNRLCSLSNRQRQQIRIEYEKLYKMDANIFEDQLIHDIKTHLAGNFQNLILALVWRPEEFDANEIRRAVKGVGTDEATLIDVLCTRSPSEMKAMVNAYDKCFPGHTAKADIQSDTSRDFKEILTKMLTTERDDDSKPVDAELAKKDAKRLYDAGPGRLGTTESVFYEIFLERSWPQLEATVQDYDRNNKKPMSSMIKSEFSGYTSDTLNTLVDIAKGGFVEYFAQRLRPSKKFAASIRRIDDARIIRTLVGRSEIDLIAILQKYEELQGHSLEKYLSDHVAGFENQDYKYGLLAVMKGNRNPTDSQQNHEQHQHHQEQEHQEHHHDQDHHEHDHVQEHPEHHHEQHHYEHHHEHHHQQKHHH